MGGPGLGGGGRRRGTEEKQSNLVVVLRDGWFMAIVLCVSPSPLLGVLSGLIVGLPS